MPQGKLFDSIYNNFRLYGSGLLFVVGIIVMAGVKLYIMPQGKLFDSIYNNFRLYGSGLLFVVGIIVMAGVKVVNKFALPLVFVVLCCIFSSFLGAFIRFNGSDSLKFCMMGERPVDVTTYYEITHVRPNCTADGLRPLFCSNGTCDAYYERVKNVKVWRGSHLPAIRLEVCNFCQRSYLDGDRYSMKTIQETVLIIKLVEAWSF
ncbi:hypothetical protein DICVIV_06434 [Dictyocaulus viviparus]|uniref:Uncharacterized protein n=1 Tax=Dictyocaulus viviparus TaxID=29172 RepID=A0A0D8XYR2_DICVI|nr:hypothetical protein DICVIV_06434 [Dictyocaulus viviparus]